MKSASLPVHSGTGAMQDVYAQQHQRIESYVTAFTLVPGQAGAVVAQDGRLMGLELFDSPATFARFFQKLLKGFALDAIDVRQALDAVSAAAIARDFIARLMASSAETFTALGEGYDVRMQCADVVAGALVADGRVRHLAGFRTADLGETSASRRAHKVQSQRSGRDGVR